MAVLLALALPALAAARVAPAPAGPGCGFSPRDWCPAPPGDPCGRHPSETACRADSRCRGLAYRGESAVACMSDGKGFSSNCPAVGCISRYEAPGKAPRADVVQKVCAPPRGGEGAEIHVWRTDRNEAAILELRQGAAGRPHPAIVFHDIAGNAQLSLPVALPAPESALGRSLTEQRAALLGGLRAAETIRCVPGPEPSTSR